MTALVDPETSSRFRDFVADRFGLRFDDAKLGFLGELLQRRANARGAVASRYMALVDEDPAEAGLLAEELTVGETYFFRNPDQFRAFTEIVLPEAMRMRAATRQLRFLSAGCSSGEEPFTLAMLASGLLPSAQWQVSIRAVDLNPAALRRADSGRYSAWALRETPADMLERWFLPAGRDMQLVPEIRQAVRFDRRNLADPDSDIWRPEAYDAIFCRNVIMYFTPEVQQAVIGRIARSLVPGGYLFLGHAETLRGLSQGFHLVHTHDTFYYQRRSGPDEASGRPYIDVDAYLPRVVPAAAAALDTGWYESIGAASRRIEALSRRDAEVPPIAPPLAGWTLAEALDLLQRERFAEALERVGALPADAADDPDVQLLRALLLVQSGRLVAAAETCRVLLARDELSAGANYVLALCFEGTGEASAAAHHYGVAGHLDAQFAMPRLRRGMLARRSGRLDDARRDLAEGLSLLEREEASRLLLFGGGFTRAALTRLCQSELTACGEAP